MKPRRHTGRDRSGIRGAALLLGALAAAPAHAGGGASCRLAATPFAFGAYVPFSNAPADFTATITVVCTATGTASVPLRASIALTGASGPSGRRLTDGSYALRYQLYLDAARTVVWGDGSGVGGTRAVSGAVGPSVPLRQVVTVYGRILARQSGAHVGSYASQITAILNY